MNGIAFVFPGQGSQHPGMGKALADAFPESREIFRRADEALGVSLSRTCFEGSESELAMTETTQPAILTVSVAALRALQVRGVSAQATAGHSLGEYSAHVAAETFEFEDAVRTVRLRGRFMQEAVPAGEGAMAALLGLEVETVISICREAAEGQVVSPANLNGPGQVVIAGHAAAVERAVEQAKAAGAKRAVPLQVSAPFHCALMKPAADRLTPVLHDVAFRDPRVSVYANVDGSPVKTGSEARHALIEQVVSPVRWHDLITAMLDGGIGTVVELGPGRVLSALVKRIRKDVQVLTVSDPEGVEKAARSLAPALQSGGGDGATRELGGKP